MWLAVNKNKQNGFFFHNFDFGAFRVPDILLFEVGFSILQEFLLFPQKESAVDSN